MILSSDVEHCYCAVVLFLRRISLSDISVLLVLDLMSIGQKFLRSYACMHRTTEGNILIRFLAIWKRRAETEMLGSLQSLSSARISPYNIFIFVFFFFRFLAYHTIIHSSFDQGVKPIGLPKRAFSRTWRLLGGRAKSDRPSILSLCTLSGKRRGRRIVRRRQ